ncbi:ABC transporter permease [Streptomyces sp. NRRL F-4489]|uniref:ABC transporter permease n=1 Tax=Streptomyces sp. NRRL F-4489 TaxID=1609095 RepID=UPI000747DFE3|nr:ABC-2 family transporter protein [Streptomyces sp. NRRL F-4489]KUL35704.1 ABC transporter permease [Streptomyces sp. NRRL F-4489]
MWYVAVAAGSFRRYATYRAATAAGLVTNTVFGFLLASAYTALWQQRPHLGGYGPAQALTFVWAGQALLAAAQVGVGGVAELQERIRSGDIAVDLHRPADLQLWWLAADLGRAALQLIGRGAVPLAVGALAFPLALPDSPLTWGWFVLSAMLGAVVGFALRYLVALSGFWLLDSSGPAMVSALAGLFFSGMLLPLRVFPGGLADLAQLLPWAALLQVPADVLTGARSGGALLRGLAFQAAWAAALLALGRLVQAAATRKAVVHGG